MAWLLYTNTCIYLLTGKQPEYQRRILARLDALPRDEHPVISAVVLSDTAIRCAKKPLAQG